MNIYPLKSVAAILSGILFLSSCGCAKNQNLNVIGQTIIGNDKVADDERFPVTKEVVDPNGIKGKVLAGYQGWFQAPSDGSGMKNWGHWTMNNLPPNPMGIKIETFPAVSEYEKLYRTTYKPLPDGTPTQVYSAYDAQTVDTHFKWMNQYGIDGVAVQRFEYAFQDFAAHFDKVLSNIKASAEKYGRVFYLEYDVTGSAGKEFSDKLKADFKRVKNEMKLLDSKSYIRIDGKPVIELWGIGIAGSDKKSPQDSLELIRWFQDQGCYVIGGVDAGWRENSYGYATGDDYSEVYKAFDMLNPWTVGRFKNASGARKYADILKEDVKACKENGQEFMPVIYSGHSWSNWFPGDPKANGIPRNAGEFIWEQFKNAVDAKADAIFIAMFDEYDEATAIAKSATDSLSIPAQDNAYFLTMSADGTYCSEDYYLRLAGKMNRIFKKKDSMSKEIPIDTADRPIWLRTGFEKGFDVVFRNIPDKDTVSGFEGSIESVKGEKAKTRQTSIKLSGKSLGKAEASYSILDKLNIKITKDLRISYQQYAENIGGQRVSIDLITTDGQRLSATDANKMDPLVPGKLHSNLQEWTKISFPVGEYLEGKTLETVCVTYHNKGEEEVTCYIDDLTIYNGKK